MNYYDVLFQCVARVRAASVDDAKDIVRRGSRPLALGEPEILNVERSDGKDAVWEDEEADVNGR